MSAQNPPISHRPPPDQQPEAAPGPGPAEQPPDQVSDQRLDALREKLKVFGPWIGYGVFFFTAFLLFVYWTFPYDRVRDKIIAEFDKSQRVPPGAPRNQLTIGKLEPSWFTGVVLRDVALTTYPSDPSKAPSVLRADEVRARVALGSIFSSAKDLSFTAHALGGTIEGSVTHKLSSTKDDGSKTASKKDAGPKYDRAIKMELDNISLAELTPLRDAIGTVVGGTLKGTIDVTYGETRIDKANGTVALEIENFWVSDGKTPFKVPALKPMFGSEDITLPQISIGNVPIQISVKNGVATVEKFEGKGKDLDLNVDGRITLRESVPESDLGLGLRFKFNDTYKKKNESATGLLLLLDSEPKLRASKRSDGFYALRASGPLANPMIAPMGGGGAAIGGFPPLGGAKLPPP